MEEVQAYLEKKQISQLFNRLITVISLEQPQNIKEFINEHLKKLKYFRDNPKLSEPSYITSSDIELIFDSYDIMKSGEVTYQMLQQAMDVLCVPDTWAEKYPELKPGSMISRPNFVSIVNAEISANSYDIHKI